MQVMDPSELRVYSQFRAYRHAVNTINHGKTLSIHREAIRQLQLEWLTRRNKQRWYIASGSMLQVLYTFDISYKIVKRMALVMKIRGKL